MGERRTATQPAGLSRRDVLRRGAVAGSVAWVAPILTSLPAHATGVTSPLDCTRTFGVRMTRRELQYLFDPPPDRPAENPITPEPTLPDRSTTTDPRSTTTGKDGSTTTAPTTTTTTAPTTTTTVPTTTTTVPTTTTTVPTTTTTVPTTTTPPTTVPAPTTTTTFNLGPAERIAARADAGLPVTTTTTAVAAAGRLPDDLIEVEWYQPCPEIREWRTNHPDVNVERAPVELQPVRVQTLDDLAWVINLPKGALPDGAADCRLIIACALAGRQSCMGYVDPDPPDPRDHIVRIVFEQCNPAAQIHAVQIIYCCP